MTPESLHMGAPKLLQEHLSVIEVLNDDKKFASSGLIINSNLENQSCFYETTNIDVGVAHQKTKSI